MIHYEMELESSGTDWDAYFRTFAYNVYRKDQGSEQTPIFRSFMTYESHIKSILYARGLA